MSICLSPATLPHTDPVGTWLLRYAVVQPRHAGPAADPGATPTEGDTIAAGGLEPIEIPRTIGGAFHWPNYQAEIVREIDLAPSVEMIGRVTAREAPNLAKAPAGVRLAVEKAKVARAKDLGHG